MVPQGAMRFFRFGGIYMKVGVFSNLRGGPGRFTPYLGENPGHLEFVLLPGEPDRAHLPELKEAGCEALIYFNDHKESPDYFEELARLGVRYLVTCSAGYDQFDLDAMKACGIRGANVPQYSPNAIAEHTVMMALALLRHLKVQFRHIREHQFGVRGLAGREMRNMKVGIVGYGRIGRVTAECLSGFHPKEILFYDHHKKEGGPARQVSLEELYRTSDIILFHCSYTEANHHMVNDKTLREMKDGVVLVNSARGPLFDTEAILRGLASGKIGALGLDVIENEMALRRDKGELTKETEALLDRLLAYDNVIYTSHTAFLTDEAERNMAETTVENLREYAETGQCGNELVH